MKWQKKTEWKKRADIECEDTNSKKNLLLHRFVFCCCFGQFFVRSNMFLFARFFFYVQRTNERMKERTKTKKSTTNCIHIGWEEPSHAIILFVKVFGCPNKPNTPRRTERTRRVAEKSSAFIKQVWIWCVKWMWEIDSCQVQLMPLKVFLCESENSSTTTTMRGRKKEQKKTKTIPLSLWHVVQFFRFWQHVRLAKLFPYRFQFNLDICLHLVLRSTHSGFIILKNSCGVLLPVQPRSSFL